MATQSLTGENLKSVTIASTVQTDVVALEQIRLQAREFFTELSSTHGHLLDPIAKVLAKGDLPAGGVIDNFEMLTIRRGAKIVGYSETYRGYPDERTAYIPLLYLAERGCGVGTATVTHLLKRFEAAGFFKIRLTVLLTNTRALKFWHKMGFDKITKITLSADANTIEIEKEKEIQRGQETSPLRGLLVRGRRPAVSLKLLASPKL
jgi:ribosomal protein S18 acetylase RimI-like enzyme